MIKEVVSGCFKFKNERKTRDPPFPSARVHFQIVYFKDNVAASVQNNGRTNFESVAFEIKFTLFINYILLF